MTHVEIILDDVFFIVLLVPRTVMKRSFSKFNSLNAPIRDCDSVEKAVKSSTSN
jgi:hypothetical protein